MIKPLFTAFLLVVGPVVFAQQDDQPEDTSWKKIYQETPTRLHDLVHTKLDVTPDFSKSYLYGKEWVTLHPHFYPTDLLVLDAKGMDIQQVALVKGTQQFPLKYRYDDLQLHIQLDRVYKSTENYTLYIQYTSKPNEFAAKYDKNELLGIKGLFFINPTGEIKDKPTQIWTQGETESSSAWFPTIDKTAQKTTQELTVTVDNKYVTLSNGKLVSQKKNVNGTRSDYWKMDLPHSPYLFFLGVGDYTVIKDTWRSKEVNYYVEKPYAGVARKIFGNTPEMMTYFSKITGVDYPWVKYAQMTGRDFVAGAMENTTATLHQSTAQQDARQLVDVNAWENTIAHELFHQWFGDYVTAESWSNLTLNESFANYSETLWNEYKYGKDAGDAENYQDMQGYLNSGSENKDLVRFHYASREDMFDAVSYNKGGRILHMLRNQVGDEAFFKSMNNYLTTYKFKSAEAHQLRLSFEEVTGRDLNWFFNQWYFGNDHPIVDIDYVYDDAKGTVKVIVQQTQSKLFRLPITVDIYNGSTKTRRTVWANDAVDTFIFNYTKRPDLVNVDGDKILLWEKNDHKTLDNYIHQYSYAGNYVDRLEALAIAVQQQDNPKAVDLLTKGLADPFAGLRSFVASNLKMNVAPVRAATEARLLTIANTDRDALTRAAAIKALGNLRNKAYTELFKKASTDSSYTISGNAVQALYKLDPAAATQLAKAFYQQPINGTLEVVVTTILAATGDETIYDKLLEDFAAAPLQARFNSIATLSSALIALQNTEKFKRGIDEIVRFRNMIPEALRGQALPFINGQLLAGIAAQKDAAAKQNPTNTALKEQAEYVKSKLPEEDRKGF